MKKRKQKFLIALILIVSILTGIFAGSANFNLNKSNYVSTAIVCHDTSVALVFSARELQKHLKLITGYNFPIVLKKKAYKKVFYIGVVPESDKKVLQPEESRYLITPDEIFIYGEDNIVNNGSDSIETMTNFNINRTGTLFAVYNFLEKELGVHWIEPGDDGIYYLPSDNIVLLTKSDSWLSPFTLARGFRVTGFLPNSYWRSEEKIVPAEFRLNPEQANEKTLETRLWLKRMRMGNRGPKLQLGHAFNEWWVKYGTTHPEYFALNGKGERAPLGRIERIKMCPSSPGLAEQIVKDWIEAKKTGKAGNIFSICENDGDGRGSLEFCHCDNCKALDFLKPGEEFGANLTDRYVYLANNVIKLARKYDLDASPSTYAYGDYITPPRNIKVDSGVVLGFVPGFNDDFKYTNSIYEGWKKMGGGRIVLRTNDLYVEFGLPLGAEKRVYEHFQLAVKNGATGTDWDQCLGFWSGIAGLNYYVLGKGHVDPAKPFKYWEDEYASMYGEAKEDIKKYYTYWREEVFEKRLYPADRERGKVHNDGYLNYSDVVFYGKNVNKYYFKTDFDTTDKFLQDGSNKNLNNVQRNLLNKLILAARHNRLQYEAMLANQAGNPESSKEAAAKLLDFRIKNKDALFINWAILFESQHHSGDILGLDKLESSKTGNKANQSDKQKIQLFKKPYRVLVIIGDQWTDPMSYNIDPRRVKGTDFLDVVTMLKIWGVPFDILRLDEQRLQINRFLDGEAKPNYGCVIWMADPDILKGYSANYATLKQAVEEYGISMIALFDNIRTKQVADIVGVTVENVKKTQLGGENARFTITAKHFITQEAGGVSLPDVKLSGQVTIPEADGITRNTRENTADITTINLVNCSATGSSKVLGTVGSIPQFVVRDVNKETKVIWIGGGKDWFRKFPVMRGIFRKSLVYSIGYGVFNDVFDNGFICIMDDVGCSEHAWSLRWHYPTPHKDTLIKYLIEPLEKYGFMMVQNITPGFANPEKKLIESPWTVPPFKDIFGNWQDYGSTKEGLDEGLRRGVFEIQPHRAWSHMNWDLDSPPGPWWGSPVDSELAVTDWYNEVVDVRRGYTPVPSNDLLFIYKMGIDAIKKAFGVVPLAAEVRPGAELREGTHGGDDNGRIAAIAGLGVSRECYVGFDHTIEFKMMMPQQFTFHDLDLTARTNYPADETDAGWNKLLKMSTEQLMASKIAGGRRINIRDNSDWIESRKNKHWMGFNETCAYLHTNITNANKNNNGIEVEYDDHFCRYFEKKPSFWTLELSDSFREDLGYNGSVSVDGKKINTVLGSKQLLEVPAGLGIHKIKLISGH